MDLPCDALAERASLGCALQDAAAILPPAEDFCEAPHRAVAAAIHAIRARGAVPDVALILDEIRHQPDEVEVNSYDLVAMRADVPIAANAAEYARIVSERARERKVVQLFDKFTAYLEKGFPLAKIMPNFLAAMSKLSVEARNPVTAGTALTMLADDIAKGRDRDRLFFGLRGLDEMIQGVRTQQVLTIGGAPATGKSALALQIATHFAANYGPVALTSQEMRADENAERLAAQRANRKIREITRDASAVRRVAEEFAGLPMDIYDWRMGLGEWAACMRGFAARHGRISAFVLDYVQLMQRGSGDAKEHEFLNDAMPCAKGLAQELDCVGIVLAQLKADARTEGVEPTGESFRGPAVLESSDKAFILWSRGEQIFAKVVKNRQGPTGNVELRFARDRVTFSDPSGPATVGFGEVPI